MKKSLVTPMLGLAVGLLGSAHAATLSWSASAPAQDGADIANFSGVSADADNILGGVDGGTYVAGNQPAQGQTFTTSGAADQSLNAITVQHVNYAGTYWSLDSGWAGYNDGRFSLQVGTISGGVFTPLITETASMVSSAPPNQNPGTGSAQFATITLDSPLALSASTAYAFVLTVTADFDPGNTPYFELNGDGTTSANYADGEAFSLTGTFGGGDATSAVVARTGDRVFHLDIGVVPEPSIALLGGLGILGLLRRRRI